MELVVPILMTWILSLVHSQVASAMPAGDPEKTKVANSRMFRGKGKIRKSSSRRSNSLTNNFLTNSFNFSNRPRKTLPKKYKKVAFQ